MTRCAVKQRYAEMCCEARLRRDVLEAELILLSSNPWPRFREQSYCGFDFCTSLACRALKRVTAISRELFHRPLRSGCFFFNFTDPLVDMIDLGACVHQPFWGSPSLPLSLAQPTLRWHSLSQGVRPSSVLSLLGSPSVFGSAGSKSGCFHFGETQDIDQPAIYEPCNQMQDSPSPRPTVQSSSTFMMGVSLAALQSSSPHASQNENHQDEYFKKQLRQTHSPRDHGKPRSSGMHPLVNGMNYYTSDKAELAALRVDIDYFRCQYGLNKTSIYAKCKSDLGCSPSLSHFLSEYLPGGTCS